MPIGLNLIEHTVLQCRRNAYHEVQAMLLCQFGPEVHRVAFILGKDTVGCAGERTGVEKKNPMNTVSSGDQALSKVCSAAGAVPGNG